jgi:hypothetical protein
MFVRRARPSDGLMHDVRMRALCLEKLMTAPGHHEMECQFCTES